MRFATKTMIAMAAVTMLAACGDTTNNHYGWLDDAGNATSDAGVSQDDATTSSEDAAAKPDAYKFAWPDKGVEPDLPPKPDMGVPDKGVEPDSSTPKPDTGPPTPVVETLNKPKDIVMKAGEKRHIGNYFTYTNGIKVDNPVLEKDLDVVADKGGTVSEDDNWLTAGNNPGWTKLIACWEVPVPKQCVDLWVYVKAKTPPPADAGVPDTMAPDQGLPPDSAVPDSQPPDAGVPDTMAPDQGLPPDSGVGDMGSDVLITDAGVDTLGDSGASDSTAGDMGSDVLITDAGSDALSADSGSSDASVTGTLTVAVIAGTVNAPGVTIKVSEVSSTTPVTKTSVDGVPTVFSLEPGLYQVEVSKVGFKTKKTNNAYGVAANSNTSLSLPLSPDGSIKAGDLLKPAFVLPVNSAFNFCGKVYYYAGTSLIPTPVPCGELTLGALTGPLTMHATDPLTVITDPTVTGSASVEFTWDNGTPADTTDDKAAGATIEVVPAP